MEGWVHENPLKKYMKMKLKNAYKVVLFQDTLVSKKAQDCSLRSGTWKKTTRWEKNGFR